MPDLVIRSYVPADISAITAIYRHYVEQTVITFDIEPPDETVMAEKFGHMVELGHPVLIGETDGRVIGYAYASFYRPRAAYRFTCEDSIYLHPDFVGHGLGGQLFGRLLEGSRSAGFKQMLAVIAAERENSIRLHEKHGFRLVGRYEAVGFKFDRWLDVVHLQRAL